MDKHIKGYILVVISLLLTSISFILSTIVIKEIGVPSTAFFMFAAGLIASTMILIASRKVKELTLLVRRYWKPVIAIGILNSISAVLWLSSLNLIGPSLTAFLGRFGTIFTIILGLLFLKERFNRLELLGAIIMIGGAFVLSYNGGNFIIIGVILVLILSLTFSVWQLITKIYIKRINPIAMNHIRLMFTFTVFALYIAATQDLNVPSLNIIGLAALGSISGGVIGFLLSYKAMQMTDLSKISTISSLEPFIVMLYSFIILHTIPTGYQFLGGFIIVAGTLFLVMGRYKPKFIERFIE